MNQIMNTTKINILNHFLISIILAMMTMNVNANVPILQPGSPGEPTKELDPNTEIGRASCRERV